VTLAASALALPPTIHTRSIIAKALNAEGITTPRKGKWDARRVINLLHRLEGKQ
jgi:hypothetical protein